MGFTQKSSCAPWIPATKPSKRRPRAGGSSAPPLNVYGQKLGVCDTKGTGFTRDGMCTPHSEDSGSHLVCLKNMGTEFCEKTQQSDWCGSVNTDNWCVCVHKFNQYKQNDGAQAIDCDATHIDALGSSDWVKAACPGHITT